MAIVSPTRIGNMALSHIGVSSVIESLTENVPEANQINLWYGFSREQALEILDWTFARRRQTLALHSDDAPEDVWTFRYQYPADAIKIRSLVNPAGKLADASPFEIEMSDDGTEKTILTNIEDAVAVYTFNTQATTLFSPLFIEALSYLLAHHISFPLTGSPEIKKEMLQTYIALVRVAQTYNALEVQADPPRDAEHSRDRA